MDFPIFHLDFIGNRFLIAIIAITHVLMSHGLAVGMVPLVAFLERKGILAKNPLEGQRWDRLAFRLLFFSFILTTTVGAMTGVGIWFSVSLVNPASIASLLRVFFWAWFVEWIVFVTEVCLILAYYLTWKKAGASGASKAKHWRLGAALAFFSWITMAIIVSILGFMMDPGSWLTGKTLWTGFTNPIYLPQLSFRTPLAMLLAGTVAFALLNFFEREDLEFRARARRVISGWLLFWAPCVGVGLAWYLSVVPEFMRANYDVALGTQAYTDWYSVLIKIMGASGVIVVLCALWGFLQPKRLPKVLTPLPFLLLFVFVAQFERIREFVRKPYVIKGYMYSNAIRVDDYPLLKKEGVLANSAFSSVQVITDANRIDAGRDVFMISCSRCHAVLGTNSVIAKFDALIGDEWDPEMMSGLIQNVHTVRKFMPPFPGTEAEAKALVEFLIHEKQSREPVLGAQNIGVPSL